MSLKKICANLANNHVYDREVPVVAIEFAKKHNLVICVCGSDDLVYAYGSDCEIVREIEIDKSLLGDESPFQQVRELGLDIDSFSPVIEDREHEKFVIFADDTKTDMYGFGIVFSLS